MNKALDNVKLLKLPLAARNAAFKAMTKRQRAVVVAQDTHAQLISGKVQATTGTYFRMPNYLYDKYPEDHSAQLLFEESNASCHACAIGASFVSCIRMGNQVTVGDMHIMNSKFLPTMFKTTQAAFTKRELMAMEVIHEEHDRTGFFKQEEFVLMEPQITQLKGRTADYKRHTIMHNVIKNNGRFVIPGVHLSSTKKNKD